MFHDEMNGEKAEDLKKLLYWVKSMKNKMIINCIKTWKTSRNGITKQEYQNHNHTMFYKKIITSTCSDMD